MFRPIFWYIVASLFVALVIGVGIVARGYLAAPERSTEEAVILEIAPGAGLREIAEELRARDLIRSPRAFMIYAYLTGKSRGLRPGMYELPGNLSAPNIAGRLSRGEGREATVTVPEGSNIFDIDAALAKRRVTKPGEFAKYALEKQLEGRLFPDTYRFYFGSSPEDVASRMTKEFEKRMAPHFAKAPEGQVEEYIIMASILEREVRGEEDRQVVAGILLKRLEAGMALQVDASICYAKRLENQGEDCYPVTVLDTQMPHDYNTYLNTGWPPGPIGNPGISALLAALSHVKSPYWYYLSDPATGKTIFSKDLEEHEANRYEYLLSR